MEYSAICKGLFFRDKGLSLDQWAGKGNRVGLPFRAHCRTIESQRRAGAFITELAQARWQQGEAASRRWGDCVGLFVALVLGRLH